MAPSKLNIYELWRAQTKWPLVCLALVWLKSVFVSTDKIIEVVASNPQRAKQGQSKKESINQPKPWWVVKPSLSWSVRSLNASLHQHQIPLLRNFRSLGIMLPLQHHHQQFLLTRILALSAKASLGRMVLFTPNKPSNTALKWYSYNSHFLGFWTLLLICRVVLINGCFGIQI